MPVSHLEIQARKLTRLKTLLEFAKSEYQIHTDTPSEPYWQGLMIGYQHSIEILLETETPELQEEIKLWPDVPELTVVEIDEISNDEQIALDLSTTKQHRCEADSASKR